MSGANGVTFLNNNLISKVAPTSNLSDLTNDSLNGGELDATNLNVEAETETATEELNEAAEEAYKREILRLRIENERLKKNYAVQMNEAGEPEYVRLKQKSLK